MNAFLNTTGEKIIKWGTRNKWFKPTVLEVIAEDVLPHVILALFLLIFLQMYLIHRDYAKLPLDVRLKHEREYGGLLWGAKQEIETAKAAKAAEDAEATAAEGQKSGGGGGGSSSSSRGGGGGEDGENAGSGGGGEGGGRGKDGGSSGPRRRNKNKNKKGK